MRWTILTCGVLGLIALGYFYTQSCCAEERKSLILDQGAQACLGDAKKGTSHALLVSGVVSQEDIATLTAFANYLSKQTGYSLKVVAVSSYTHLSQTQQSDPKAVAWVCGLPYVQDREALGLRIVAVPLFRGRPLYESWILTRAGRPEKRLLDFRGAIFGYSDPRSNSGYLAPQYALAKNGIKMESFFSRQIWCRNHVGSIEAVVSGLVDVAAVDEYIYVQYRKAHPEIDKQVRVLERFGPFPFTPIVAGKGVPEQVVARLRNALVQMPRTPEGRRLLQQMGLDGFEEVAPEFYEPIEKRWRFVQSH